MGNSSDPVKTTTTVNLTPEQKMLQGYAMPGYKKFADASASGGITAPGAESVSPFDPLQTQGQEQVLANTGAQQDIVGSAGKASQFLTSGDALSPDANPWLRATMDAAVRPIFENLTSQVLPNIRGEAVTNGQYGGSRQGIAEGLAGRSAIQAAADSAAKIGSAGYAGGLDAMKSALVAAPSTATAQSIPGSTTSSVGDVRQQLAQKELTADTNANQFQQYLPFMTADMLNKAASGTAGGSTTSVGTAPQGPSVPQMMLGAGSVAAGLAPYITSDERAKENILPIGTTFDGQTIYRYRYKGSSAFQIGLIAQEVEKLNPEAVVDVGGIKMVDYELATRRAVMMSGDQDAQA